MPHTVLHIDASARSKESASRGLTARIVDQLKPDSTIRRDLASPLPLASENWIGANFTPEDQRTDEQRDILALSDTLIAEISLADTIVIGLPIYNFSVPASLKAWIDLITRVGLSFEYTETGPRGLLTGKRAIVAYVSGGTQLGSDMDFASGYIRHILGFIGITEIEFISADQLAIDPETSLAAANRAVDQIAA
ncbi:MAG: NAD(P)H-dependent oxidoreductase [Rhodobacteraceae bacterium]|nr:NAD(P)H-dependent oxidoreductase [Paracoccaceae bacterium]